MESRRGTTRAQSKSPARGKKSSERPKSPSRQKSPGRRTKSPGRPKSPGRARSPGRPKSPGRQKTVSQDTKTVSPGRNVSSAVRTSPVRRISPERKISPIRKISPARRFSPAISSGRVTRGSPYVALNRTDETSLPKPGADLFRSEGLESEVEVLFIDDNVKFKTSISNVKFGGEINVGDVRQVKWEDGNYYEARILNFMEITRERSVSVPYASVSTVTSTQTYSTESSLLRRSSRLQRDDQLIKSASENEEGDKILKANNVPLPPQFERKYGEKPVREFGNWPGALIAMLLLPSFAILMQFSCTKSKCVGINIPSTKWKVYLDTHSAGYYLAFLAWQALLSSLPIGRKASYGLVQARISGFYNLLLTMSVLAGLYYYGINVTEVLGKSIALLSAAILYSLVLAFLLFFKGRKPSAVSNLNADGNKIYDFFIGREILPVFGPLNIKAMIVRTEFIGILLLDTLYVLKYYETHAAGVYSPTLLFVMATHAVYVLDTMLFEENAMTTFEAQCEGVGYMSVMAAAVWPFLFTLATRFILFTGYEAPPYQLSICACTYLIGYLLYRASNSQKAEFRKNPQNPVFAKYETISTFHGKRILNGGFWGVVRHPNYLGDIIMMWSMAAPCALAHWLPYVFPTLHLLVLLHRTFRVNYRCKSLYGAAWDRYKQIVKYRLVPRVF